jgi:hypothetical protein
MYEHVHEATSELHLSDVALHREGAASEHSLLQTTFVFALHPRATTTSSVDDDGDLLLQRKKRLTLRHHGATSLDSVALQIWPASVLLADYIIHVAEQEKLMGCVVELGSGCSALASLVASLIKPTLPIFATDAHLKSLHCLAANIKSNNIGSNVRIRKLDWMTDDIDLLASCSPSPAGLFDWTEEDLQKIESEDGILLLSADCIYDESLTEAMIDAAYCLMKRSKGPAVLLVAMEKRFTFTLRDLDSRAPAYDHFVSLLHIIDESNQDQIGGLGEVEGVKKRMKGRRIDVRSTVPEAISCSPVHINRSLDLLELWQIELAS